MCRCAIPTFTILFLTITGCGSDGPASQPSGESSSSSSSGGGAGTSGSASGDPISTSGAAPSTDATSGESTSGVGSDSDVTGLGGSGTTQETDSGVGPGSTGTTEGTTTGVDESTSTGGSTEDTGANDDTGGTESAGGTGASCALPDANLGSAVGQGLVVDTTCGASPDYDASCTYEGFEPYMGPDLAYIWTAPADDTYVFDLAGSDFDTVLSLRTPCPEDAELLCDDNGNWDYTSKANRDMAEGETVVIVVTAYYHGGSCGEFVLSVQPKPPPPPVTDTEGHRRVFVTNMTYRGDLGGLAGADEKCQAAADNAGLTGTFMAWLSDATGTPASRFDTGGISYRLTDGRTLAEGWGDFTDGTLDNQASYSDWAYADGSEAFLGNTGFWSNTAASGDQQALGGSDCWDWMSQGNFSEGRPSGGVPENSVSWSEHTGVSYCNYYRALLCIEQTAYVP